MSSRDAVLAAVRTALAGHRGPPVTVPRGYRDRRPSGDVVALFVERVEDYRASVTRCTTDDLAATVEDLVGARSCIVPAGLPVDVPGSVTDTGQSAAELDAIQVVVTTATLGIAETGTLVLDHGAGQGRRALSLVPDEHVCVLRVDQVVGTVPDAVALLDPVRAQTWVSGPSATSDIELNRVEGVHGPRTLNVILVDDSRGAAPRSRVTVTRRTPVVRASPQRGAGWM